ncbi:shikimate dehydrogenase [Fodinibius sp. Rm-B-1B1-1]|uniref:shikimate dehydrogenase n=1 Tax=Fodinibius alkaliphilus TaxID=3140241 RepID=UPI00315A742F
MSDKIIMTLSDFKKSDKSNTPFYALLGYPIEHSWSPLMHNLALKYHNIEAQYVAIAVQNNELNELAAFFNEENFLGANITIPYKEILMDYLDSIDPSAKAIGAINTIVKNDFQLRGTNTDYKGFKAPLLDYEYELDGSSAIVFGTGGASRSIVVALRDMGLSRIYLVSRSPGSNSSSWINRKDVELISYNNWTSFLDDTFLIVNATPLGMHPDVNQSPVREAEKYFLQDRICYDIVYNPLETKFLKQAKEVGAQTINGLEMLIQQGNKSFELWTGKSFPIDKIRKRLHERIKN